MDSQFAQATTLFLVFFFGVMEILTFGQVRNGNSKFGIRIIGNAEEQDLEN